jgi:hypothetical protein
MKQKIYFLGLLTVLLLVAGTLFKVNHYPGAAILLTAGITTLVFVFLPVALLNHYRSEGNRQTRPLYIVTWVTALVIFISMLFKIQHWPYSGIMLMISLPFPYVVFLPVFLWVTSKIEKFNIYNTVFVMLVLTGLSGFSALLALNVSPERIEDSLSFSIHYNKYEKAMKDIPINETRKSGTIKNGTLIQKADEVIAILDEAQKQLYAKAETTEAQWKIDPGRSGNLDSRNASGILFKGEVPQIAYRLDTGVKNFLNELEKTQGCEKLATIAPLLLGFTSSEDRKVPWTGRLFAGNYLSWILIDMDLIRLNLSILKMEIAAI